MSHSHPSMHPPGGEGARRALLPPASHEALMARVFDRAKMRRAWKRVPSNKGAPGMDGMGLQDFPEFARSYGPTIRQQRADGTSQPHAVRRVTLPKPQGGERLLGIPTVTDRVSQQAMAHVLTPIGDPAFSAASCGVRPGRAAPGALRQVQGPIKAGDCLAVALDVAQCVDNVQHDVLMARVARRVRDKQVVGLIGRSVRAGVLVGESIQATERGTPQGGPLAPWLAHILLDALDRALERRG